MGATDTIVALSTPPGRSGIGVVRVSGPHALLIARQLINDDRFDPDANHAVLRTIFEPESGDALDSALVTWFRSPHSFTGEDIIEFSCHGSPVLLRRLVDAVLRLGARAADAGEFTLRAVRNGRINLAQAEAIRDLINARTDAAVRRAVRQMKGELSVRLQPLKEDLLEVIVRLESALEFVEDDLPDVVSEEIDSKLTNLITELGLLTSTFRTGRLLNEGLRVTLAGRPNVGKSSLFNSLIAQDRAIVTEIPGTTRDSLSETVDLNGIPVMLQDTAGVRRSEDRIESLGVERTRRAIADSDLVVVVLDGSQPFIAEDEDVLREVKDLTYVVAINKSDLGSLSQALPRNVPDAAQVSRVSAKTREGLDELKAAILAPFASNGAERNGVILTDARHFDVLQRALASVSISIDLLRQDASEELTLVGLHDALKFLGEITGETTPDDVLGIIFSTFCIGK